MSKKHSNAAPSQSSGLVTSNAPAQLELTAYQQGQAVVRERRVISLGKGHNLVQLAGLPTQFVPGSLTVVSVEGSGQFKLGPLSYRPANLNVQSMLQAALGSHITIVTDTAQGTQRVSGTLRYLLGSTAVLEQEGGKVVTLPFSQKFELLGLPAGLTEAASLIMEPTVSDGGKFTVNVLYETDGITWQPRYEAFYDASSEKLLRLACWVEVTNNSGAKLDNAKFKLLAGSNHGRHTRNNLEAMPMAMAASVGGAKRSRSVAVEYDSAEAESVGEQKLYVLPGTLTLASGETKQTYLMYAENVPVRPEYYLGQGWYGEEPSSEEDAQKLPVNLRLRLKNDKRSCLGSALPAGTVNVFEPDSAGSLQKTDSTAMGHVAEDEEFKLDLRNPSKDLKATRRLDYFHQDPEPEEEDDSEDLTPVPHPFPVHPLGGADVGTPEAGSRQRAELAASAGKKKEKKPAPRFQEEERSVTISNYKDKDVEVLVYESFPHNAQFIKKSQDFAEQAQGSGTFRVAVPAKGKATVSYRIRFQIN